MGRHSLETEHGEKAEKLFRDIAIQEGYSVKKIKKYSDLNETMDVAIILIKQKNALNYHWMCFPVDKNILSFFGKDTILKEIYLISK